MNGAQFAKSLVDTGCLSYATVSDSLVKAFDLPRIRISPRILDGVVANQGKIHHMTYFDIDVHGHQQGRIFAYVIPGQIEEMMLGLPWMKEVDAHFSARRGYMDIFTQVGEKTRCWNRANPSIGPLKVKRTRIAKVSAKTLLQGIKEN